MMSNIIRKSILQTLSPLQLHTNFWQNCHDCPLGARARKHVLYELFPPTNPDSTPTTKVDILFVGEGPGEAEDVLGQPFIGPAGRLLRPILEREAQGIPYGLTNLVACRPQDKMAGENRDPLPPEVYACAPRLTHLIKLLCPTIIVALGKLPDSYLSPSLKHRIEPPAYFCIPHPMYIGYKDGESSPEYAPYCGAIQGIFECMATINQMRKDNVDDQNTFHEIASNWSLGPIPGWGDSRTVK